MCKRADKYDVYYYAAWRKKPICGSSTATKDEILAVAATNGLSWDSVEDLQALHDKILYNEEARNVCKTMIKTLKKRGQKNER